MIAADTGFFVEYLNANELAAEIWARARADQQKLIMSVITIFELRRLALKGEIKRSQTGMFVELAPRVCSIVYLDEANSYELLDRAARIAHGNGLSMADSLILTSALDAGATVLYTTDSDMAKYRGERGLEIVRL
ncbi:MAG: PIN domain-containing protein [Trueperaceae bacterium]|nr:MAG: PIN domain-containing protein [Trueperaceae bacterium]